MRVVVRMELEIDESALRSHLNDESPEIYPEGAFGNLSAIRDYIGNTLLSNVQYDSIDVSVHGEIAVEIKE